MSDELIFHAFFTHNWAKDQKGRSNHDRVVQVAKMLQKKGFKIWLDESEMTGHIKLQMCDGIDKSHLVVMFVTKKYVEKVGLPPSDDNCSFEFNYAVQRRQGRVIVSHLTALEVCAERFEPPC